MQGPYTRYNDNFSFCPYQLSLVRGRHLSDIILGFKCFKKQNSLPGLLVALNFIFNHQTEVREHPRYNDLQTRPALVTWRQPGQSRWRVTSVLCSLFANGATFCLVQTCMSHNTYFQKHPDRNGESHHIKLWEFEPELCQYSKSQNCFDDLLIHEQHRAICYFCKSWCEQSSQYQVK